MLQGRLLWKRYFHFCTTSTLSRSIPSFLECESINAVLMAAFGSSKYYGEICGSLVSVT